MLHLVKSLCLLVAAMYSFSLFAGDTDIHFAGEGESPSVVSGEVSAGSEKDLLEFRGDSPESADAMYKDIKLAIEKAAKNLDPDKSNTTVPAVMVTRKSGIEEFIEIDFAIMKYAGKTYLVADMANGLSLVWTLSEKFDSSGD